MFLWIWIRDTLDWRAGKVEVEHPTRAGWKVENLGGGFKHVLFSSLFGEDFHFD